MHGSSTPEHHARIIGTSRFGQPIAIYKNRTYELMPLDAEFSEPSVLPQEDQEDGLQDRLHVGDQH